MDVSTNACVPRNCHAMYIRHVHILDMYGSASVSQSVSLTRNLRMFDAIRNRLDHQSPGDQDIRGHDSGQAVDRDRRKGALHQGARRAAAGEKEKRFR